MTQPLLKPQAMPDYVALTEKTVAAYLAKLPKLTARLGGVPDAWQVREVGDGNLNLVFIVTGATGALCVKQALPYVRLVGESWPLPLSRALFEYAALVEQTKAAPDYIPALYHHDAPMALTVMEYLTPHIILRKGLIGGTKYPHIGQHLGEFLGLTLFKTSDLHLPATEKKKKLAYYAANTAMCKISEDLIFDEPYFNAPMNRHTQGLQDVADDFRRDAALKNAIQEMKARFMNNGEALLHGDLHTGSVMVTETDTRVIDPEFAFYGPMGFDIGAVIANFLLAYFAQPGHAQKDGYDMWVAQQIPQIWQHFTAVFKKLWLARTMEQPGGDVYPPRVMMVSEDIINMRLGAIWQDTLGFTAAKMIRRILGLAHVEDFESIEDHALRAACECRALFFARDIILNRAHYPNAEAVIAAAKNEKN